jgi:hypothetical protein
MSSNNRRDSSRSLRSVPKAAPFGDEVTTPDARAPRFSDEPQRAEIRSFATPVRSARPSAGASRSGAQAPAAAANPPNVIPFTKPRAIAAIAASSPGAVVTMERSANPSAPSTSTHGGGGRPTKPMASASSSSAQPSAYDPRLSRGWTPPHAVKTVAQPERARQPAIAVTAWPAANASAPVQASAHARGISPQGYAPMTASQSGQLAVAQVAQPVAAPPPMHVYAPAHPPAPVFAPPPSPIAPAAVVTTRPATHMQAAPAPAAPAPAAYAPAAYAPAAHAPALPAPPAAARVKEPLRKWAEYIKLGLGPPKINSQKAAKFIVNVYRLLGFAILTIIVVVLVGYIASTAYYYMSDSWLMPMAVTPTDEKVVALQAQLAEQQNARDRIADELQQAERAILAQQTFQAEFAKAIRSDLEGRKLALGRIRELATTASRTRAAIKNQNAAYANASRQRMQQEYAAGLIDRNAMLSGKYQIAQITSSNLSLAERQAEFETRAAELEAQTRSLDAILANAGDGSPALSYEVLRIKQEYEASRLDLAKSMESRNSLKAALARQDKIVSSLQGSAYLRALRDKASVAFVPYANIENAGKGTSLYACKLGMLFCYNVGEVLEVLPGEVQFKHPQRERMLRGQLVVLKLDKDDVDAAAEDVLFLDGRPILF